MYRIASSHLRALKQHGSSRFASTNVVKQSSGGLFGWLFGGKLSQLPTLDVPLPGITLPPSLPDFVEPARTKVTTLPNGIKIASETSMSPAATVGLYVDCGSMYETSDSSGVSYLLERMSFKSTTNRSHLRLVREVESIGGNVSASASRDQMCYTYDAFKAYVPEMVEVLIDSVRNPAFFDWEIKEQLQKIKAEIAEVSNNPQGLVLEALHSAAYSGALAKPLMAPEAAIHRLDSSILKEFIFENYTAPRMVLAASGVEHDVLVSVAEPLLSDLPGVKRPEEPKSVYVGGDYRCQADSQSTHVALAFEVPGGWYEEKTAIIVTVLQMLMGGGGSFSAGGPGKGMHSRLYLRILNHYHQIESFSAFNSIYNHSGLFGIHAITIMDRHNLVYDFGSFMRDEPLREDGCNFIYWYQNLRDHLTLNDILYIIEEPLADPMLDANGEEDDEDYLTRRDISIYVHSVMFVCMVPDLQVRFFDHDAHDMIVGLSALRSSS